MKHVAELDIRDTPGGAVLRVKVVPNSSRDKIVGVLGDCLKVATSAAPEKGKANVAVAAVLAKALSLDKRGVELTAGHTKARKEFLIADMTAAQLRQTLSQL